MKKVILVSIVILAFGCSSQQTADLILQNGTIYTVNESAPVAEAVAVKNGQIVFVGSNMEAASWQGNNTKLVDLDGKTMTPGFIEGHGHLMGLGYNELDLDLLSVKSYEEMVSMVKEAAETATPGEWILGRGWHQDKWDSLPENMIKGFQTHHKLSEVSPNNPVFLRHASGHLAIANSKAMEIAGINLLSNEQLETELQGGEVFRDELGNPTGIFNELAMTLIDKHIPKSTEERDRSALELAIKACHENGITSFHDAGVYQSNIDLYEKFLDEGKLGIRIYAMIYGREESLLEEWLKRGIYEDSSRFLSVRSIKLNCDGALGSRGAWLLEDYADMPGQKGHETFPMEKVLEISNKALETGFQVCSHAIGDRANREILDRYEIAFDNHPEQAENSRFRIEHAQHIHPDDIPRFAELGVIPAMQAIHMSSDRPWAIDRLGKKRIEEGAYMWQTLLKSGAVIVNGTDVPVEPINPIACFYSSVSRKTLKGEPEDGYEPAEKMTRDQALRSYTLDAAYGEFSEDVKGSIEVGKLADFTVFSQDIMNIEESEILNTVVDMTIVDGNIVYNRVQE